MGHCRRRAHLLSSTSVNSVRGGVHALHLVENHTLVGKRLLGILDLEVPALLLQCPRGEGRVENRIKVHVDEVVKVLEVLQKRNFELEFTVSTYIRDVSHGTRKPCSHEHEENIARIIVRVVHL
jgi:hypothetical protein